MAKKATRGVTVTTNELFEACLLEMFRRVGLDYTIEEVLEYAKQDEWYTLKTWTQEEDEDFQGWMYKFLGKKTRWTAKQRKREVGMFMLCYGWKISP